MSEIFGFDYSAIKHVGEGPRECPICHQKISTQKPLAHIVRSNEVQLAFECPGCSQLFIAYYHFTATRNNRTGSITRHLILDRMEPNKSFPEPFSETINKLSPMFVSIYNEAKTAKENGLSQVAGPGFRKAFEFLIKDYAKSGKEKAEDKNRIEGEFSGVVVNNYISDERIKELAKRVLWLGNDETHYLRIWEDRDINDLLTLISLAIHWIEIDLLSSQYINSMPRKS